MNKKLHVGYFRIQPSMMTYDDSGLEGNFKVI